MFKIVEGQEPLGIYLQGISIVWSILLGGIHHKKRNGSYSSENVSEDLYFFFGRSIDLGVNWRTTGWSGGEWSWWTQGTGRCMWLVFSWQEWLFLEVFVSSEKSHLESRSGFFSQNTVRLFWAIPLDFYDNATRTIFWQLDFLVNVWGSLGRVLPIQGGELLHTNSPKMIPKMFVQLLWLRNLPTC